MTYPTAARNASERHLSLKAEQGSDANAFAIDQKRARQSFTAANDMCGLCLPEAQSIACRRRHQPRRPPPAKMRPGRPAPAMGPGTGTGAAGSVMIVARRYPAARTEKSRDPA